MESTPSGSKKKEQKVQIQLFRGKSSQEGGNGLGFRSKQRERTALLIGKNHNCRGGELRRWVWLKSKIYRERSVNMSKSHVMQGKRKMRVIALRVTYSGDADKGA